MYYLYHIPGKKIGVTTNLKKRVEDQQGYAEGEYDVIIESDNISEISRAEIELQKAFGYKVDRQSYDKLKFNRKMKINVTEQTTTFPCPVNKLKGQLMDNLGMTWHTDHGTFTVNEHSVGWLMANAKESMYNVERCYVYNKAFGKYHDKDPLRNMVRHTGHEASICNTECDADLFDKIREWANDRGLYEKGDPKTQYIKLIEEAGEVGRAILKDDTEEIIDGIGDMVVVLTNLAELIGYPIEECMRDAYNVISKRTGKMENGTFVKDTL